MAWVRQNDELKKQRSGFIIETTDPFCKEYCLRGQIICTTCEGEYTPKVIIRVS